MRVKKYETIYKKIDRSTLNWGITIPTHLYEDFPGRKGLKLGASKQIKILWDRKAFSAKLNHSSTGRNKYLQIRYDMNPYLLKKLRKTFIQSYVILQSKKELFDATETERQFRSHLPGGHQEVLTIQPVDPNTFQFNVFIRIENEWNALFQRLADENVFAWVFDKEKNYLISRSTAWMPAKNFNKHKHANNVIYYLAHTKKKLLYIGKAENFGRRVKPGKKHQEMLGDWDLFKYDVIKPEFSNILEKIEDHTIRSFASILKNDKECSSLNLSPYRLVNHKWDKL